MEKLKNSVYDVMQSLDILYSMLHELAHQISNRVNQMENIIQSNDFNYYDKLPYEKISEMTTSQLNRVANEVLKDLKGDFSDIQDVYNNILNEYENMNAGEVNV